MENRGRSIQVEERRGGKEPSMFMGRRQKPEEPMHSEKWGKWSKMRQTGARSGPFYFIPMGIHRGFLSIGVWTESIGFAFFKSHSAVYMCRKEC